MDLDLSTSPNQNSFPVFLRLPDKLIAEILALFGTVVFAIDIDLCRQFINPEPGASGRKEKFLIFSDDIRDCRINGAVFPPARCSCN